MRSLLALLGTTLLLASACGRPQNQDSQSKALVSQTQADEAFAIVKAIDYIPFAYIEDGCYARALYMSMELAAQGIPSSAHYIYGNLRPNEDVSWWYHVAPLLKVGAEEPWVLDPAFEKEPLRRSDWISKNNPNGRYTTEIKAGSAYFDEIGRTSEFNNNHMIQDFEEMPTFLASDISNACTVMYNYLRNTADDTSDLTALRNKLLTRTSQLVEALQDNGKFENDGSGSDANRVCRKAIGL